MFDLVRRQATELRDTLTLPEHFDTWMQKRTDAEHAAYMARTAALPQ